MCPPPSIGKYIHGVWLFSGLVGMVVSAGITSHLGVFL